MCTEKGKPNELIEISQERAINPSVQWVKDLIKSECSLVISEIVIYIMNRKIADLCMFCFSDVKMDEPYEG